MSAYSLYDQYIERLKQIRSLSSPSLNGIDDASEYNQRLRENYIRIGQLAAENRAILDDYLFPLLNRDSELTEEETSDIDSFEEQLLTAENAENLDLPMAAIVSERLLHDSAKKGDMLPRLRWMDAYISVCYALMNMTARLDDYPEIAMHYRKKGLELGELFIALREKENFLRIESAEARELVLTNARFAAAFYENQTGDREANRKSLEMLRASLEIAEDPFYTELMPDFDWRYYRYRLLDYFAHSTDICNRRGMEGEQLTEIWLRSEEMWALWHSDPEYFSALEKESYVDQLLARNRYYAQKITPEAYRDKLLEIYHNRDKSLYDICGVVENIQVPIELLGLCGKIRISEADKMLIYTLDYNVLAYVFHMPNSSVLSFMLEDSTHFFRHFIEFPGGTRFERLMLRFLAATHPPTFVHSRMVAHLSTCLCGHLIDRSPGLLIGVEGCTTAEEVLQKRDDILWFVWHAALCHDAGKIFIMDTIFVYGRKLLDMEFDLIKTHPKVGASMLKRFPGTAKYADVALGHHKWYDNSRGYPEEFDTSKRPVKTVIDLVLCADCLDAATDTVGRSYNRGKSFDEFCAEVREGSGTRYAPWLHDLLSEPDVREDIEFLLTKGREKNYYDTYQLLKTIHDKEMQ